MSNLAKHAAWVLMATFAMALMYGLYRATIMAGISEHDSIRTFVFQGLPFYVVAAIVIATLFARFKWAPSVGLAFSVACILVSIFYYNPQIMLSRQSGMIDWFEDLVFTGLLSVAAALLLYSIVGRPGG